MDIFECVKRMLLTKIKGSKEIMPESSFESLGLDSMEKVDFILKLEEALGITFEDEDFFGFNTVQDVLNQIDREKH